MNKLRKHYLFHRCLLLIGLLFLFSLILLVILTIVAISSGKHIILAVTGLILLIIMAYLGMHWIWIPWKETEKMLELFMNGYSMQSVHELRYPFTPAMEQSLKKLESMLNVNKLISATKKQSQYLALQNQINPHFLYNTLEGIRGEALMAGLDTVAQMTEALATFFRYTISNLEQLVTLEDELDNIQDYYIIQQYRFGERINLKVECDEDDREQIMKYRLPKLTLQPIVENAIIHGIEQKISPGIIRIKLKYTGKRLLIRVTDDGIGIPESRLQELNQQLNSPSFEYVKNEGKNKGGVAVINVNNRIRLLFGEEYGLTIYSTVNVGTDVDITLPLITQSEGIRHEK